MSNTTEKAVVRAMRAGFTLIEIMVAVAIVGIMSTMAVIQVVSMMEKAKKDAATSAVHNIKNAHTTYATLHKRFPSDLNALIVADGDDEPLIAGGEGGLEDPWGTQFRLEGSGKKAVVVCAGPDMEFGTEDDIRSDKIKTSKK